MLVVARFTGRQGVEIQAISNPGNRQLRFCDEKMARNLISVHQLSTDLLLLQLKRNTFKDNLTGYK